MLYVASLWLLFFRKCAEKTIILAKELAAIEISGGKNNDAV
jgi:hypothetical protein